ncbi:hypothetical protein CRUP_019858 [Coryphaenoides rupestris]|nr:hypothetical protein CRUP_019858 [Coryphaenoides rupestris]
MAGGGYWEVIVRQLQHAHYAVAPPPKIVFNRLNGKRYHTTPTPKTDTPPDGFTPAHEENVKFVSEAWQEVEQKMGDGEQEGREPISAPVQYSEKTMGPVMKSK